MNKKEFPEIQVASGVPEVIVVEGSDYEMGYQYGTKLAEKIFASVAVSSKSVYSAFGKETTNQDMQVLQRFAEQYDPGLLEWQRGVMDGCTARGYKVTMEDLMLLTAFTSEFWAHPTKPYPETMDQSEIEPSELFGAPDKTEKHFCTGFAAAGDAVKEGEPLIGVSGGSAYEAIDRIILISFPDDGPSTITFPTIGKSYDQEGMNSNGFAWVMTGNMSEDYGWGIMPEVAFHFLTRYISKPEDAIKWLSEIPRSGAFANFVMCDAEGDISVVETNAHHFFVRKPGHMGETKNFALVTNHFEAPETRGYNISLDGMDWQVWNRNSITRYATAWEYLKEAAEKDGIDIEMLRKMYHSDDWFDPDTKEWHINEPGVDQGFNSGFDGFDYTHQSVLCPQSKTAYLIQGTGSGVGMPAGSTGEFAQIGLKDSPLACADSMQELTFNQFIRARAYLSKMVNGCESIKKNYLLKKELLNMLDEAYLAYESGWNRAAFAYREGQEQQPQKEAILSLLSEAMSYYVKAQLKIGQLKSELDELANS